MKKINRILLFSVMLLTSHITFGQLAENDSVNLIVAEMDSSNVYETSYTVGYAGSISKQYLRMEKLSGIISNNKLTDLALHYPNAVVRLYALLLLKQKKITIPENIVVAFANDATSVNTLNGCYGGVGSVRSLSNEILNLSGIKKIRFQ